MASLPSLNRWLTALASGGIFAAVVVLAGLNGSGDAVRLDAGAPGAKALSWHMFGGTPSRNFVNPDAKGLPVKWDVDDGTNVLWAADLGSKAYGGPVVADGRVFVGTNNQKPRDPKWVKDGKPIDLGIVMSFAQKDGKFLWQQVFTKLPSGRVNDWPEEGICSTPVIEKDRMYYVSNRCEVICAETATGNILWKLDMIGKLGVFPHNIAVCSPLLIDDFLWIVTANGVDEGHINVPAPKAPSFIKVSKKNGDVLWQNNTPTIKVTEVPKEGDQEAFFKKLVNRGELIQHGQWSNPAYAVVDGQPQVIFPGGEGWIYSFDPSNGKLLWKFDCNPKDSEYELQGRGTRNDFIATPVIYDNKVYIGVGQDPEHETGVGHLWCIAMNKRGDVSPTLADYSTWPPKTKPNPNSAKVWHYGGFTTPEDRRKLRRNYYFGRTMSTCAIKDGILYVAELQGQLHCLDAATGKVHWTHDTRASVWSSPYLADGKVYLGNDDGEITVFAFGKEKKVLASNVMDGAVRATPVAVGDTLYVMTENKLYAIRTKD